MGDPDLSSAPLNGLRSRLHPGRLRRTAGAAGCVRESVSFAFKELGPAAHVGQYTLRGSGLQVRVRHPLLDMWAVEEMFRFRTYQPPPSVLAALAKRARPLRIADLGGHVGCFGLFARSLYPDARIVSFEPDPGNGELLRDTIEANGLGDCWELVPACAAPADGTADFASDFHLSRIAPRSDSPLRDIHSRIAGAFPFMRGTALLESEWRQVPCRDAFPYLVEADLIKIDIEGSEWELLADPRLAGLSAAAIVLEFHPLYCPDADAGYVVREALSRAGYHVGVPVAGGDAELVWAWKPAGSQHHGS